MKTAEKLLSICEAFSKDFDDDFNAEFINQLYQERTGKSTILAPRKMKTILDDLRRDMELDPSALSDAAWLSSQGKIDTKSIMVAHRGNKPTHGVANHIADALYRVSFLLEEHGF